jgi:hypothetical protein
MKCISSPALDDTQIVSFMEGEADDAVVAHIKECPYCREKARKWTRLQNRLKKQSYRVTCPTPMELGDYHLGFLSDSQKLVVAQHVRECLLCQQEVAILENFLSSLAPESNLLGAAKVLIARLMGTGMDSGLAPALRGEAKGPLTFEADGLVIVLDIQPGNEGRFNILGQVAADDQDQWTGALVELRRDDQLQCSAMIDDLGAFQCEGMMAGKQELRLTPASGSPVVVSNVEF